MTVAQARNCICFSDSSVNTQDNKKRNLINPKETNVRMCSKLAARLLK